MSNNFINTPTTSRVHTNNYSSEQTKGELLSITHQWIAKRNVSFKDTPGPKMTPFFPQEKYCIFGMQHI